MPPLLAWVTIGLLGLAIGSFNSLVFYIIGIPTALVAPWMACALYAAVAIIWLVPDRRIERVVSDTP